MLGAIIISFAFFFGYNRLTKSAGKLGSNQAVAVVNGISIPTEDFTFFYDQNIERLKKAFAGEDLSDNIKSFAQNMTLQQLIRRALLNNLASELGIVIPDNQLAAAIKEQVKNLSGGEFDPVFYKQQYMPYFQNRYGINYEEMMREDIALENLEKILTLKSIGSIELQNPENTKWYFNIVVFNPKKLLSEKKIADESQGLDLAKSLLKEPLKNWDKISKSKGADFKSLGPIDLAQRQTILNGSGTLEDFENIFSLNQQTPVISEPIRHGDMTYVVGLVKKENENKESQPAENTQNVFLDNWLQKSLSEAEVINYLPDNNKS